MRTPLCGVGINVATTQNAQAMVMPIPRIAWDALVDMYGTDGSPIVPITAFDSEQEMDCSICAVSFSRWLVIDR